MEHRTFDRWVRAFGEGMSRRGMLRRLAASSLGGAAVAPGSALAAGAPSGRCRSAGKTCDAQQTCCRGLICTPLGAGQFRCMPAGQPGASASVSSSAGGASSSVCAGNCAPQTAGAGGAVGGIGLAPVYVVDVTCTYQSAAFQSVCVALAHGAAGSPPVRSITLPAGGVCAVVVDERAKPGTYEEVAISSGGGGGQASAGTGGTANAEASGGTVAIGNVQGGNTTIAVDASGGTASANAAGGDNNVAIAGGGTVGREWRQVKPTSLTVVLEGKVEPAQPTTYWLETDAGRFPATGPALSRVGTATAGTGALRVDVMACAIGAPQAGYDWFGQCTEPAAPIEFSLTAVDGAAAPLRQRSNDRGQVYFTGLTPGRYRLDPVAATWCYATSDAVDETGQVTVAADQTTRVWIFTCGGS
ncbi:MAG: hypothetical protein IT337_13200 [Thermomicrobiales bacterium]|nr:hypothetical protein [Thermomicrobiales bacterium]